MKKKLFSIIMCILMVMCFMPTAAFAQDTGSDTTPTGTTDSQTGTTETPAVEEDCQHVAAIGTTHYDSLAAAFTAVQEGETIKILKDCETGSGYGDTYDEALKLTEDNVTLDLNEKTITETENFSFWIAGVNDVVKNGYIKSGYNSAKTCEYHSYAIIVANKGIVLDGLNITGGVSSGINSTMTAEATLRNCTVVGGDYYAVASQSYAVFTIESGTYKGYYTGQTFNKVLYANFADDDGARGKINVVGGTFEGSLTVNSTHIGSDTLNVTGGTFTDLSVSNYLGEGADVTVELDKDTTISSEVAVPNLTIEEGATLSFSGSGKLTVSGNLIVNGTLDLSGSSTDFSTSGNATLAADRTLTIKQGGTFDIYGTVISKSNSNDICQLGTMTIYASAKFYADSSTLYIGGANDAALNRLSTGTVVSTPITAGSFAGGYYYDITGTAEAGTTNISFPITGNDVFRVKYGAKLTATNISTALSEKAAYCIEVESGGTLAVGNTGDVKFTNALQYLKSGATFEPTENITIANVSSGQPIFEIIRGDFEVTLNLNNKTITTNTNNTFYLKKGAKLNVTGSGEMKIADGYQMLFTVKGNGNTNASRVTKLVIGKDVKITGGKYTIAVDRFSNKYISGYDAEVDIYGSLSGTETIYVSGNVTATDGGNVPEIRLHSGAKIEDTCGIYLAGYAKTTIEDGVSITAEDGNAISIAAGELTINGGTIKSANTLGTSEGIGGAIDEETCSALSIKQHVTNLPLIVNVNGGTFEAAIPFNQQTGQSVDEGNTAAPDKVQLSITNGTFTSTSCASGATSVKSADKTGFITGGTFSTNPSAYLADGCVVVGNADGTWSVKKTGTSEDGTKVEVETKEDGTQTVTETTKEKTTTTETKTEGTATTTTTIVATNPVRDTKTGATTATTTEIVVTKNANTGEEVKTKTETTEVTKKTDTAATTETTVKTTASDGKTQEVVTKTVEDKGNNVAVTTTVEEKTAKVTAKIAEDKTVNTKAITVDATAAAADEAKVEAAEVTLPVETLKALKEVTADTATRKVESVELKTNVATLEISNEALKTLTKGADETNALVLSVEKVATTQEESTETAAGTKVTAKFDLTAMIGNQNVFDSTGSESNGTITVKVPYTLTNKDSTVKVFYQPETGAKQYMDATYKDGYVSWETNHFSVYGIEEQKGEITISVTDTENAASKVSTTPGKEVKFNVSLDNNTKGLTALQVELDYNKNVLELTKVDYSESTFSTYLDPDSATEADDPNYNVLSFGDTTGNVKGTGLLATLTFKVKADAPTGSYDIKLINVDTTTVGEVEITPTTHNAQVTVSSYGDVDGNGKVELSDIMQLRRHVAKWGGYKELANLKAGDLNSDGKYTLRDVQILTYYHAGDYEGYETLPYKKASQTA